MQSEKPQTSLKIAVLVTTYKRPEYTKKCVEAIERDQKQSTLPYEIFYHGGDEGLRSAVIDFFNLYKHYDYIAKIDNDCVVPLNWLSDMIAIFQTSDIAILSPNVFPSDAAHKYGHEVEGLPYIPSKIVGGLWMMKGELLKDMVFDKYDVSGLTGAFPLLKQIIVEKDPKVGWAKNVVVQDIGHWSGQHPEHIKSPEHEMYSHEVGRRIAWQS